MALIGTGSVAIRAQLPNLVLIGCVWRLGFDWWPRPGYDWSVTERGCGTDE